MLLEATVDTLEGIDEPYQALYTKRGEKYEFTGVRGIKTGADVEAVQKALNAERLISKDLKAKLSAWNEMDPIATLEILDKVPELQSLADASKRKFEPAEMEAAVNGRVAPLQRQLEKAAADLKERDEKLSDLARRETQRTIFDAVRKEATATKANPDTYGSDLGALMLLSREMFTVDAAGQVVVKEGVPGLTHGTNVKDAIPEIQKQFPSIWPSSVGGGAPGSGSGPGAQANPFKSNDFVARSAFARQFPDKVDAMVKQAGLSDAGSRYVPTK
jgi:hypothetical protein